MLDNIYKMLKQGENADARDHLCRELEKLILESDKGLIGIGDFTTELEKLTNQSKNFLAEFPLYD